MAGLARASGEDDPIWIDSGVVREEPTSDPALVYYVVRLRDGSLLLSVDRDVPIARWLERHRGRRIAMTLRAGEPIAR